MPMWFNRWGWTSLGQARVVFKPFHAEYFFREMGLGRDFKVSRERDNNALSITSADR